MGMDHAMSTETSADRLYTTAMTQVENGELRKASGLLWDASVAAFTALAKRRGWAISKHMHYDDVYRNIRSELPGDVLFHGMNSARLMERNWVEDYDLSESWVLHCADRVSDMINAFQSV